LISHSSYHRNDGHHGAPNHHSLHGAPNHLHGDLQGEHHGELRRDDHLRDVLHDVFHDVFHDAYFSLQQPMAMLVQQQMGSKVTEQTVAATA